MERKSLPVHPSLDQLRKQAKEIVKKHRDQDIAAFALIRQHLPALSAKTDEEILLYPFALHDAQSVVARQHGFPGWNQLRDEVEKLAAPVSGRFRPESSVEMKFQTICSAYEKEDYRMFCSVMNDAMRAGISEDHFKKVCNSAFNYFRSDYLALYFGEMSERERTVHFWRISAPGRNTDLMARMGIKDEQVSGLILSSPFGGLSSKSK